LYRTSLSKQFLPLSTYCLIRTSRPLPQLLGNLCNNPLPKPSDSVCFGPSPLLQSLFGYPLVPWGPCEPPNYYSPIVTCLWTVWGEIFFFPSFRNNRRHKSTSRRQNLRTSPPSFPLHLTPKPPSSIFLQLHNLGGGGLLDALYPEPVQASPSN